MRVDRRPNTTSFLVKKRDAPQAKDVRAYEDENGCWICCSHSFNPQGYPKLKVGSRDVKVVHFLLGPNPSGKVVRHLCNNRGCINPVHLSHSTQSQNLMDRVKIGTANRGIRNGRAVLSSKDLDWLDKQFETNRSNQSLADALGVNRQTVANYRHGRFYQDRKYR